MQICVGDYRAICGVRQGGVAGGEGGWRAGQTATLSS